MEDTLAQIAQMHPDSLTVHSLAIKRAARMEMEDLNRDAKETHEILSGMIERAAKAAKEMDLFPYYLYRQSRMAGNLENVGWSKKGYESLYNVYVMDETHTILGCGSGAVTKLKRNNPDYLERIFNFKYPYEYIDRFEEMIKRKNAISAFYTQ